MLEEISRDPIAFLALLISVLSALTALGSLLTSRASKHLSSSSRGFRKECREVERNRGEIIENRAGVYGRRKRITRDRPNCLQGETLPKTRTEALHLRQRSHSLPANESQRRRCCESFLHLKTSVGNHTNSLCSGQFKSIPAKEESDNISIPVTNDVILAVASNRFIITESEEISLRMGERIPKLLLIAKGSIPGPVPGLKDDSFRISYFAKPKFSENNVVDKSLLLKISSIRQILEDNKDDLNSYSDKNDVALLY